MDPDDLAAAFFAQQAAKEQKKVTLPTSDWVHVIEARRAADESVGDGDAKVEVDHRAANSNSNSDKDSTTMRSMDPESWLVTTMPAAPTYRDSGAVGIPLNTLDCMSILSIGGDETVMAPFEKEETDIRHRIKMELVNKLQESLKK